MSKYDSMQHRWLPLIQFDIRSLDDIFGLTVCLVSSGDLPLIWWIVNLFQICFLTFYCLVNNLYGSNCHRAAHEITITDRGLQLLLVANQSKHCYPHAAEPAKKRTPRVRQMTNRQKLPTGPYPHCRASDTSIAWFSIDLRFILLASCNRNALVSSIRRQQ